MATAENFSYAEKKRPWASILIFTKPSTLQRRIAPSAWRFTKSDTFERVRGNICNKCPGGLKTRWYDDFFDHGWTNFFSRDPQTFRRVEKRKCFPSFLKKIIRRTRPIRFWVSRMRDRGKEVFISLAILLAWNFFGQERMTSEIQIFRHGHQRSRPWIVGAHGNLSRRTSRRMFHSSACAVSLY